MTDFVFRFTHLIIMWWRNLVNMKNRYLNAMDLVNKSIKKSRFLIKVYKCFFFISKKTTCFKVFFPLTFITSMVVRMLQTYFHTNLLEEVTIRLHCRLHQKML